MSACIETTWPRTAKGYGHSNGRLAHREAWEAANGRRVPPGMVVMHDCDNPPCVNSEHLRVGTYKDNTQDAKAKGRLFSTPVCPQGHDKDKVDRRGWRYCSLCHREQTREYARRKRAQRKVAA